MKSGKGMSSTTVLFRGRAAMAFDLDADAVECGSTKFVKVSLVRKATKLRLGGMIEVYPSVFCEEE